jgi:protein SCO1
MRPAVRGLWVVLIGLVVTLMGCVRSAQFSATDITGADWGRDFHLIDHSGKPRRLADFKGKAVAIFFGYTQCPDVCPTTLSGMAEVVKLLGADGARLQVLFVTLDPERDTPAVLSRYVPAFNSSFVGLYGDLASTTATAKEFKVFFEKQPGVSPGSYTIDHSSPTYLFDPQGRLRLYVAYGTPPQKIAGDIQQLLAGK